jgi:hypothetical protein
MDRYSWLRGLALLATIATLLGMAGPAAAGPIIWNLENVTFDDGFTAAGTFTTNNGAITDWNITTTGNTTTATLPAFTYTPSNSDSYGSSSSSNPGSLSDINFITLDNLRYLRLQFSAPLPTPGTYPILISNPPTTFLSYECGNNPSCSIIREVTAGAVESVPEPPAAVLLGAGLLALGLVRRPRRQAMTTEREPA